MRNVFPDGLKTSEALQEARFRICTKTLRFCFFFVKQTFLVSFLLSLNVASPRPLSLRTRQLLERDALRLKTSALLAHRTAAFRGRGLGPSARSHWRRRGRGSARALAPNMTRTLRPGRPRTVICSFLTFEQWPEGPRPRSRAAPFPARGDASAVGGGSGSVRAFMNAVVAYAAGAAPPWLRAGARPLGSGWPLLGALEPSAEQKPARDRGVRGSARRAHVAVPESSPFGGSGAVAFKFSQRSGASGPFSSVAGAGGATAGAATPGAAARVPTPAPTATATATTSASAARGGPRRFRRARGPGERGAGAGIEGARWGPEGARAGRRGVSARSASQPGRPLPAGDFSVFFFVSVLCVPET